MEEQEIEVRNLSGESITISILPTKTVAELKSILKERFLPASSSSSSDFHLFLRGKKLCVQSLIGSHIINSGEFIALMPFSKKAKPLTLQPEDSGVAVQTTQENAPSNLAESAWRDMMEDLSYLSNKMPSEEQPGCSPNCWSDKSKGDTKIKDHISNNGRKRRKTSQVDSNPGLAEDLISSLLHSSGKHVLDVNVCEKILKVLESVYCLSYAESGKCMLLSKADKQEPTFSCLCPTWLTMMIKTFTFLNILAGYLQMHRETLTYDLVKDSLGKLGELGFCASVEDLKDLADFFPKIVRFIDQEAETKLSLDVIVVINSSKEKMDQDKSYVKARKKIPVSKILNSIKRRQTLFRTTLQEGLRLHVPHGNCEKIISLEQFITSVKKTGPCSYGTAAAKCRSPVEARCCETHPLTPTSMLEHLKMGFGSAGQIVHVEEVNGRVADFAEIPEELSENTKSALKRLGITKLYRHQAESIRASLCGRNVVVSTMTSSGKSVCYNLPVLEALSQDQSSCALYLFPTKALAQDQLRALLSMTENFESFNIGVYDGDTSQEQRNWLRDNARLLITNPDMLHMSILPFHRQFQRILSNLKFVVFDEAHAYKGAFGCHTALILRRLRRLCSHVYGSDPSFVFSTATSANPREHAMELANLPTMDLIDKDGSPSASKLFVLWNPPLYPKTVQAGTRNKTIVMKRSSPILEVSRIFAEMVQHGLRSIAFCKTRKLCELVLSYTCEILQDTAPHLVKSICAYRGGYVAEDRRRIESDFFSGKLCGIAATSALELGIDVGHIDVTLHLGFPGSVASLWQQAGRSGRRGKLSLAVYVAFEGPLDQYFMKFPSKLFQSPIECCHVDAQNPKVLEQHLICAAIEHPLSLIYDGKYFGPGLNTAVTALESRGYLSADPARESMARIWSYIGQEKSPSRSISIRAIESEKYKVIDGKTDEVLEEIEESRAFFQVYEGAIYMNQGKTYLVKELDISSKIAVCQRADVKYYTQTRDYTDIDVIGGDFAYQMRASKMQLCGTTALANSCSVTTTWFGFRRICKQTNRILDMVDLVLPKHSYESQAVWIRVPTSVKSEVEKKGYSFRAGLHAASHSVLNVVPLYIICESSDLAPECANPHETRYAPERILLYDQRPGGTGLSIRIQPLFNDLLTSALDMLTSCYCSGDVGCPNCVQTLACQEYNELLHKDAAIMIIKGVLEAEDLYFRQCSGSLEKETV
ncbi:ATP-dependent helicase HRQ1 [Bienertia sinuspersici]